MEQLDDEPPGDRSFEVWVANQLGAIRRAVEQHERRLQEMEEREGVIPAENGEELIQQMEALEDKILSELGESSGFWSAYSFTLSSPLRIVGLAFLGIVFTIIVIALVTHDVPLEALIPFTGSQAWVVASLRPIWAWGEKEEQQPHPGQEQKNDEQWPWHFP